MTELFRRWQECRDEKNKINRELEPLLVTRLLIPEEAELETMLVQRYNFLYSQMEELMGAFEDDDWEAYEADQAALREAERQAWLIKDRYGSSNPSKGIADWWLS